MWTINMYVNFWKYLQLLKDRQVADPQHDSHIGEPISDVPSVSDYGSLDAQSLLHLHTTSPKLRKAESPMGLGEAVASSIDSLLSNDPRIATMTKDYESEQSFPLPCRSHFKFNFTLVEPFTVSCMRFESADSDTKFVKPSVSREDIFWRGTICTTKSPAKEVDRPSLMPCRWQDVASAERSKKLVLQTLSAACRPGCLQQASWLQAL